LRRRPTSLTIPSPPIVTVGHNGKPLPCTMCYRRGGYDLYPAFSQFACRSNFKRTCWERAREIGVPYFFANVDFLDFGVRLRWWADGEFILGAGAGSARRITMSGKARFVAGDADRTLFPGSGRVSCDDPGGLPPAPGWFVVVEAELDRIGCPCCLGPGSVGALLGPGVIARPGLRRGSRRLHRAPAPSGFAVRLARLPKDLRCGRCGKRSRGCLVRGVFGASFRVGWCGAEALASGWAAAGDTCYCLMNCEHVLAGAVE